MKIGKIELRNRLVMGAMGNSYATEDGYINDKLIGYYVERAKGGVGMITTQAFNVSPEASHRFKTLDAFFNPLGRFLYILDSLVGQFV